jgi:hypothetical protein
MLRDVAISGDRNVIKKDLTIEIQRMLNVNTKVIPVKIRAAGTVSRSFRQYLSNIMGEN